MKKKALKYTLGLFLLYGLLFFVGCREEPIIEVSETHAGTEQSLQVFSELLSTYDIIEDFVSSNDLLFKKEESLLPSGVVIKIIDDDFLDGDGVEVVLDFGELGDEPHGLLCKDKKYRAGTIRILSDKPYSSPGAKISLIFSKEDPFYSGAGDKMILIQGEMYVERVGDQSITMQCSALKFQDGDEEISLITNLAFEKIHEAGLGILDDEIAISGELLLKKETGEVMLTSVSPLKKKYTLDCAQHIIAGKLDLNQSTSMSKISVDFDPTGDQLCDNKVVITVNGKALLYEY